jgi:ATP-dependent helicase/DNAse subunit B
MPTRVLISPPASGKTHTCIEEIRSELAAHPLSQVRVITSDRLQASYFRRRLSQSGGAMGAYVGTFTDLYKNILERAENYVPVASNALLHRILQEVVDNTDLVHYAPLRTMPGFLQVLSDSFAELKRALIYPEVFIDQSRNAPLAQQELAQLYAAYQTKLRTLGWADWEGLSWLAVAALETEPTLMNGAIQLLVVDGFDSFIPTQRRVLSLLADKGRVLITLEGRENSVRSAHRRFNKTLETLRAELSPEIMTTSRKPSLTPDVLCIEEKIFETGDVKVKKPDHAFLTEVRSPSDEAREALRWIKSLVVRNEIQVQACAIFVPNFNIYQPALNSAAREFGIPVHFTHSEPLNSSPAIAALVSLLRLPSENFQTGALFKALRSPYFSSPFDDQTIDLLEKIGRTTLVMEGQAQWQEAWDQLAPVQKEAWMDDDAERAQNDLLQGQDIFTLQKQLDAFFMRTTPPTGTLSQTDWTGWLEDLLDETKFYENADTGRDESACEGLRDALRALVMSESIAGTRLVDYNRYLSDLLGTLEGLGISEQDGKSGSVLIGTISEARGLRYRVVALLGLSEGVFPSVEHADPFLSENLRASLGLDSRLDRDQASLFYQAVTRTDEHLLITRPYLSDDGEKWEASPYWNALLRLFEKDMVLQTIRPDDARALCQAASSQEVLFWSAVKGRRDLPKPYLELQERWETLNSAREVVHARRSKRAQGIFEGDVQSLKDSFFTRYEPRHMWSASRLETYSSCPHHFFVRYALGLKTSEPTVPGLELNQRGSILHEVLEKVYKAAENPADVNTVLKELPKIAQEVFSSAPKQYGFRPSELWEMEQEQLLNILLETIPAFADVSQGWTPFKYEQKFGFQGEPPLQVQLGDGDVLIHGRIDRIDRNADGELRVVDYKLGSSHQDKKDFDSGQRLQLPIYALAAQDALELGKTVDGMYWAVQAAKPGAFRISSYENEGGAGLEAAEQTLKFHLQKIIQGIRSGIFFPDSPKGGCPDYCPAAQWCWRYEKAGW